MTTKGNTLDEKVLDIILGFVDAVEAAAVDVKHKVAELKGVQGAVAVKEETFTSLKFEPQKGERLGEFEIAARNNNLPDKWQHAYNVLRASNATIQERYHGQDYAYSYWLYNENAIYRQKLKRQGSTETAKPTSVATARDIFPKELADMLSFEETPDAWKIKPRQYLGSENFNKILAIVKQHGGEYVSEGKASHFKLPKTATKREG